MKKFNLRIIFTIISATIISLFSSCSGVIFDEIRKEVKLADAVVSGDIMSIIRYADSEGEKVFTSTGEIYYRTLSDYNEKKTFTKFSKPDGVVHTLAADSTYLYALVFSTPVKNDSGNMVYKNRSVYCYYNGTWKSIYSDSYSSSVAILFCTNTPKKDHRKAYYRIGEVVHELNGTTLLSTTTKMTLGSSTPATTPTKSTKSCTYLNNAVYFSDNYAMTSNESTNSDATCIYTCSGENVSYLKYGSTSWTSVSIGKGEVYSLAKTSDYLLIGTKKGIAHTPFSDSDKTIPKSGYASFSTNADSALSSYYEIWALLVYDPSKSEAANTIFASSTTQSTSASFKNIGLWSYFASKSQWNRE